jgi:hypothetical protein
LIIRLRGLVPRFFYPDISYNILKDATPAAAQPL